MIAVDSSVAVAAFASWHEGHRAAVRVVSEGARLVGHAAMETYAVLTRLPPPHRAPAELVVEFLRRNFQPPMLSLPERRLRSLIASLPRAGITGGAAYDALIATTALYAGASLLTRDRRAMATYERVGASVRVVG